MARYYLIPYETDKEKLKGMTFAPKYLNLIQKGRGITDWEKKTLRKYYVVIIDDDNQDMRELEKQSDVIKIDEKFSKSDLQSLGISVTGNPSKDQIEEHVVEWITGDKKTLRTL